MNICNYCNKSFSTRKTLSRHIKYYCKIVRQSINSKNINIITPINEIDRNINIINSIHYIDENIKLKQMQDKINKLEFELEKYKNFELKLEQMKDKINKLQLEFNSLNKFNIEIVKELKLLKNKFELEINELKITLLYEIKNRSINKCIENNYYIDNNYLYDLTLEKYNGDQEKAIKDILKRKDLDLIEETNKSIIDSYDIKKIIILTYYTLNSDINLLNLNQNQNKKDKLKWYNKIFTKK